MFFFFLNAGEVTSHLRKQFPHRHQVEEFIDIAREVDSAMSIGALAAFVHVTNRMPELILGDMSLRDIADEMQVPYTTFSRQLDVLADGAPSVRGLRLLEKGVIPDNRRQRQVRLTVDGERLLSRLSAVVRPRPEYPIEAGAVSVPTPAKKAGARPKKKS